MCGSVRRLSRWTDNRYSIDGYVANKTDSDWGTAADEQCAWWLTRGRLSAVSPSVRSTGQIYEGALYRYEVVFLAARRSRRSPSDRRPVDSDWLLPGWQSIEGTVEHISCLVGLFGMSEFWSPQCVVSARWSPGM